ncbi:hypothetical protein J5N97_026161 [Dioscorea zingiberensis]|uniref:Retrotransposon gag domain-containing protein n=1 Tax=Dioscorea zingiberensis TaxID=325984 RepID=A0A9D5C2U9_9LILI|nr:hypothetical protein J5N97_026161 [Dioscorea zingiberensis]
MATTQRKSKRFQTQEGGKGVSGTPPVEGAPPPGAEVPLVNVVVQSDADRVRRMAQKIEELKQALQEALPPASASCTHRSSRCTTSQGGNRRLKKNPMMLLGFRQRPEESLRGYISRFNKEINGMVDINSAIVVGIVVKGLKDGLFKDSLTREPLAGLSDFQATAAKYIASEEMKAK